MDHEPRSHVVTLKRKRYTKNKEKEKNTQKINSVNNGIQIIT